MTQEEEEEYEKAVEESLFRCLGWEQRRQHPVVLSQPACCPSPRRPPEIIASSIYSSHAHIIDHIALHGSPFSLPSVHGSPPILPYTLRIHILEKRLKRHEEQALHKYYELDHKLRSDPRLAALLQGP